MIDLGFSPESVDTLIGADDATLMWFAVFGLTVAGHKAKTTMGCIAKFVAFGPKLESESPYEYILRLDRERRLEAAVRASGFGNFRKNTLGLRDLANRGVEAIREGTFHSLRTIHGVSFKTAAFILAYTRGAKVAVLDTHILQWLRSLGHDVPRATPQSRASYERISSIFFKEAEARGTTPAALDLQIWKERSKYLDTAKPAE